MSITFLIRAKPTHKIIPFICMLTLLPSLLHVEYLLFQILTAGFQFFILGKNLPVLLNDLLKFLSKGIEHI